MNSLRAFLLTGVSLCSLLASAWGQARIPVDLSGYASTAPVRVEVGEDQLGVRWQGSGETYCEVIFSRHPERPLIASLGTMEEALDPADVILRDVDPVTLLTVGERDLDKRAGWVIFFDKVHQRPYQSYRVQVQPERYTVQSDGAKVTVTLDQVRAGSFSGFYEFTFYSGTSLLRVDTVMSTAKNGRAILYDAGLESENALWSETHWQGADDRWKTAATGEEASAQTHSVRFRTVVAGGGTGSLAVFPPPHQFFYPLDFADNFGFVWEGRNYRDLVAKPSLGVRQPLDGDRRFVPWFNAPPLTDQRMGVYWYLSPEEPKATLDSVARYTRHDTFKPLPGHQRFTSHYHVEHTLDYLKKQAAQNTTGIPEGLESPGFVKAFQRVGADIVHLAEFHNGRTPRMGTEERLRQLHRMHAECERLSTDTFLLLPGEEPNVHLGGHWLSFFPRPVNWVLNRAEGVPFQQEYPEIGTVYHVGSRADVLRLMEQEQGLMWTAHPRIKSSTGFPDAYRSEAFFQSDRFLGAAWKAMPADLSWRRLGKRVLGLLDDMSNWGGHKVALGEVDVFRVEPDYELYGHMNMNYLRLEKIPRYEDDWSSILEALRLGHFFVTTGEVLIPHFTVGGQASGGTIPVRSSGRYPLAFQAEWTFPLALVEVIAGDGERVVRQAIDLGDTVEFGQASVQTELDLTGMKWVRLEIWDSAANGAFTQPVWLGN